ncbi:hypothetical protein AB0392_16075 [Nonomuraea angiospora]|uniref:hypothetical protein n=1 Tax=Nonomuraea angiospora TaxID=46172 RepID=UPI00344C7B51
MRVCRHGLSAVLLCVAAMTACTAAYELPTLEDAARQLDSDGGALLGSAGLRLSTESPADDDSCVPGQVRRYFRAESDLTSASALLDRLQAMGYDKVVDDLDLRDGDQDVSVLRNPETWLTFELTVLSGDEPGVRVIGKTTCYTAD